MSGIDKLCGLSAGQASEARDEVDWLLSRCLLVESRNQGARPDQGHGMAWRATLKLRPEADATDNSTVVVGADDSSTKA